MSITKTFTKDKETKGAVRYREDGDPDSLVIRSIYLRKAAAEELGNPNKISATIKAK